MRAVIAAACVAVLVAPAAARAQGVDQTCDLTATRFDADTVNILFPDSSAQYWSTRYLAVPGTRIRIDGTFPYSRYTSWNVYDPILRPFAKKSDFELAPDAGSANPFLPGADRTTPTSQRHYTLFITFDPNDNPGPNTIYVDPTKNPRGVITLRVYVPDQGRDVTGGVGLPQVTWEPTSSSGPPATTSPCRNLEKPSSSTVTNAYAGTAGPGTGAPYPGRNPPAWHKFVNLCQSGSDLLFDNQAGDAIPKTGQSGNVGVVVTKTLVVSGDPSVTTTPEHPRGAMLRAYDKNNGKEVGAVWLPAPQSGSPMTYSVDGRQYIIVAVSGGNYSGEYIAFSLPAGATRRSR